MNIEHYTPIHFTKRNFHVSHFFSTHFEPFLLSVLVLTGIIGSIYLFGQNLVHQNPNGQNPKSAAFSALQINNDEAPASNEFDNYVKIETKVQSGQKVDFEFLQDEKASRYVLEMGDGVRLIVTQKNLMYTYETPGKYVIELKEIKGGLLHLIGTKKIKVK